jgi:hypothetical protein
MCLRERDWGIWTGWLWLKIGTSVNTVMKLRVPRSVEKIFSSWATGGFSRRIQLHVVRVIYKTNWWKSYIEKPPFEISRMGRKNMGLSKTTKKFEVSLAPGRNWNPGVFQSDLVSMNKMKCSFLWNRTPAEQPVVSHFISVNNLRRTC